jgi:PmbA protein
MIDNSKPTLLLDELLARAAACGADACDAVLFHSADLQVSVRKGAPEGIERSESMALGLRVWVGARQAVVSSTDIAPSAFAELAARAVGMARVATEDADSALAPAERLATHIQDLDLYDAGEPTPEWLMEQCRACEDAALSTPGITNSEGADAGYGSTRVTLATRSGSGGGFSGGYASSHFSVSVSVLAGEGTAMERDYDYASVRHRADLPPAENIGKRAAERTLARLNPRKAATCKVPVLFDPRVSRSLLSAFASAINGAAVARGTSFLKDAMGSAVFAPDIHIIDDPHRRRGLGSRPFDGEGVQNAPLMLVSGGVLQSWLLDLRTANRLKLATTGHASRGVAAAPSPSSTNLYMQAGGQTREALYSGIKSGLYVTETFGMGVNLVTGDYSQGASGFWIENGALAYPVSEITIAGHLSEMMKNATPANDLEFRYATNAPTLRIEAMTVAGA